LHGSRKIYCFKKQQLQQQPIYQQMSRKRNVFQKRIY
jgi:hypothetical protein